MIGQQRRTRRNVSIFAVLVLMIVLGTCVQAAPRREKRRDSWYQDREGADLGLGQQRRRQEQRSSDLGLPKTYRYTVDRPGKCAEDDDLFADCYQCGKLMEDVRVYEGCCEPQELIKEFCDKLLA